MKSTLLPLLGAASFSLQAPVEGINSISQSTVNTQSGQPFFTKVGVADCAIEGSAGRNSTSRYYNFQNVPDVLACQNQCLYYGGCVMYSWEPAASAPYQCTLYTAIGNEIVNATTFTESVVRGSTGIFWSDRTLRDGSYVCYSTASFTAPGTISPRTEDIVEKPSPTVTAPLAIITNFNITNCHVEGLPGNITYYGIGQKHEKNPLLCEESCLSNAKCRSYSYQEVPETNTYPNCHIYSIDFDTKINATPLVMNSRVSGIFYSNRFLPNSTEYCYLPAGSYLKVRNDVSATIAPILRTEPDQSKMIRDINTTPSTSTTITLTSTPSPTTSTAPAISTKALATCHQQGMPTTILLTFMISSHPSPSVLECQGSCKAEEKCLSYSHREVSAANSAYPNCELFSRKWDSKENGTDLVIKSWRYGIYYSDRFPGDGSEECFVAVDGN